MNSLTQKRCNVCKEVKGNNEFYKDAQKRDGLCRTCKECSKKRSSEWEKNNIEKAREHVRNFHRKNADSINEKRREARKTDSSIRENAKEYSKKYYLKNRDKLLEYTKNWGLQNKEKVQNRQRLWQINNREKTIVNAHNYRTSKIGRGKVTKEEWEKIKEVYGYKCLCCGKQEPDIKLTLDHVIPISKGGLNIKENIQPLCGSCNSSKKDKTIDFRR